MIHFEVFPNLFAFIIISIFVILDWELSLTMNLLHSATTPIFYKTKSKL